MLWYFNSCREGRDQAEFCSTIN